MLMHQLIYSVSEEKNLFGNLNRHILVRQSFYGENECCLRLSLRVYAKTFIFYYRFRYDKGSLEFNQRE
jgi:hypothetical protein